MSVPSGGGEAQWRSLLEAGFPDDVAKAHSAALCPADCSVCCRPSRWRQFCAVLHKNVLLQTRSSRSLVGAGWAALAFEVLTPAAFFLLMCLPKFYFDVKPQPIPTQLFQASDLDLPGWANTYKGVHRGL